MRLISLQRWLVLLASAMISSAPALACTTAVISGKATIDGRPLLWKNRDAPHKDNQVVYLSGEQYSCVAVVNAGQRGSVWMGVNEAGFCIENSVSRDLSEKGAKGPGNGGFMLRALQSCATVKDFKALLERTDGKRNTNANFGVIDAEGGAAIFEASASSYRMFDANDPETAPEGYVVRSNFSFTATTPIDTGEEDQLSQIYSGERYLRGCRLLDMAVRDGGLSLAYLLQHTTRDLADASGRAIPGSVNGEPGSLPVLLDTTATISRRTSVSAAVFHGVRPGEDPLLSTMWVMLGEPAFSIAVPCWAGTGGTAEELSGGETSALSDAVRELRDRYYRGSQADASSPAPLLETSMLPTLWSRTLPRERENLQRVADALAQWRTGGFCPPAAAEIHQQISRQALQELTSLAESVTVPAVSAAP